MADLRTVPDDVRSVQEAWRRRGRFVTLAEGHRIFAVQEGGGPDLVLVHGFPSTSHDFAPAPWAPSVAAAANPGVPISALASVFVR